MPYLSLRRLGVVLVLGFTVQPAAAQLTLGYTAGTELTATYDPGYEMYDIQPSLTLATVSTPPASLGYNGATGAFQLDFLAPAGHRFSVNPLDGPVSLHFWIAYTTYYAGGASGGLAASGAGTVEFLGLQGNAPDYSINSTIGDLPHAYLSFGINATEVSEALSFTGLRYTVALAGTGNEVELFQIEGGQLTVTDNSYFSAEPPGHLPIFSVTAIPEPGTYAVLAGLGALIVAGIARRRR